MKLLSASYQPLLTSFALAAFIALSPQLAHAGTLGETPSPLPTGKAGSYLAARYARQNGDEGKASQFYSYSLQHNPGNKNLMRQAVRTYALAGKVEEAARIAKTLSEQKGDTQLTHLVLLIHALKRGDVAQSQHELGQMDSLGLFSIIHPVLASWLTLAQSGKAEPIAASEPTLQLKIFEPFLALQNAMIFDRAGNAERAREYYAQAMADTGGMSYRNFLAALDFYRRHQDERAARDLFSRFAAEERSAQMVDGMRYEDVLADLTREEGKPFVANAAEGLAEELYDMAGMLYGENVGAETLLYLRLALYLRPHMPDAQLMLASLLEERGDHQEAMALYDSIPPKGAVYRQAQVRKAFLLSETGQSAQALALLAEVKKRYPESTEVYVTEGDVYRQSSRFQEAVTAYTTALSRSRKLGTELQEKHWPILFARGVCYERQGKWDLAEKDLQQALDLSPDQPDVLNYLGYSWLMQGKNLERAKELLEQAVAARPDDANIMDSMGWALYTLGDFRGALDYLEQALDLMPNDPVVNEHFGDALWRVGRKKEAHYQWERALYYGPEHDARIHLEEKLAHGLKDMPKSAPPLVSATE